MIEKSEITVRNALREDSLAIIRLLTDLGLVLPDSEDADVRNAFWDRFWDNNPYYRFFEDEVRYGWVMEHESRIVGYFGFFPRVYWLNGKNIPVSIGALWGVQKNYRAYTELLSDRFFKHNTISLKLTTTAIKPTGRLYEKYGGREVPCPELAEVYMIPLDIYRLLKYRYSNDRTRSVIFHLFMRIMGFLSIPWKLKFRWIPENKNVANIDIKDLPGDFDEWLEKYFKDKQGLIASRNSVILKWFYSDSGAMFKRIFFVYTQYQRTAGFGSLIEQPVDGDSELVRYKVVDLIAETPGVKKQIIRSMIRKVYLLGGHVLEFHHPGMIKRSEIPEITFVRRFEQFPILYQTPDKDLDELLQNAENWNITPFDGDTCLI